MRELSIGELEANKSKFASDVYGGGDAGQQIANLLQSLPLQFHKTIMY